MNANAAVDFERVAKSYGETKALDDVFLDIPLGQTVALLGPNGAGKSTAINLMLGLVTPSTGTVRILGLSPHDAVAGGRVGAMLQDAGLPVTARVDELIELIRGLYLYPLPGAEIVKRAGLAGLEKRAVDGLSGGEAQRVRYALALAGDPDLLFLDEPTVGMDVETRRAFWSDMHTLAADGRTILFATHYLDEADAVADRIIVLVHGRVVADGSGASIKATVTGRTIRFSLDGTSRESLAAIEALPYVKSVDVSGDRVVITTSDSDAVVHELVLRGLQIRDVEISGADLEDAFVALTRTQEATQ
jgi:ABC-2 type transport system ATP-binding protein